jgi:brefeldin A-resistance guanine nucleotide exchange factor 1
MTNDSVCEILQSCFQICFEARLSGKPKSFFIDFKSFRNLELLRKTSEHVLIDMVQLLFARLPQFKDDTTSIYATKPVKDLSTRNITTNNHQRINLESTTETNLTYVSIHKR